MYVFIIIHLYVFITIDYFRSLYDWNMHVIETSGTQFHCIIHILTEMIINENLDAIHSKKYRFPFWFLVECQIWIAPIRSTKSQFSVILELITTLNFLNDGGQYSISNYR